MRNKSLENTFFIFFTSSGICLSISSWGFQQLSFQREYLFTTKTPFKGNTCSHKDSHRMLKMNYHVVLWNVSTIYTLSFKKIRTLSPIFSSLDFSMCSNSVIKDVDKTKRLTTKVSLIEYNLSLTCCITNYILFWALLFLFLSFSHAWVIKLPSTHSTITY